MIFADAFGTYEFVLKFSKLLLDQKMAKTRPKLAKTI